MATIAMFGAYNKYMNGLAIPLERDTYAKTMDLLGPHGGYKPEDANASIDLDGVTPIPLPPIHNWTMKWAMLYQGI